jgi:hypothetical protein
MGGESELPGLLDHPLDHPDDPTPPSGLVWIDAAPNVSRPDHPEPNQSDVSARLRIWRLGFEPSRRVTTPAGQ